MKPLSVSLWDALRDSFAQNSDRYGPATISQRLSHKSKDSPFDDELLNDLRGCSLLLKTLFLQKTTLSLPFLQVGSALNARVWNLK